MNILHIDTGRQMRGGQWQVLYLAERQAAGGHGITLMARCGSPLYEMAKEQVLHVHPLSLAKLPEVSWEADLVHVHDARAHTLAALAAFRPVVVSRRVAFPLRTGVLSRWKYRRGAHYIAVSQHVRSKLVEGGIAEDKISVVYDGVPLETATGFAPGAGIVALATDDPQKGLALIRAAAELGGFSVHFSDDLESDLRSASAFVYITHEEGLGSAALLAMSAGVPVIASRVGGLPEIVEHEVTGLLTSNRPEEIAAAVGRLTADPELAVRLAAAARLRLEENFSVDLMVRRTLDVYHRILAC